MNKHYTMSLFDETLKTVGVKFAGLGKTYTYKTREQFEVNDRAVVETPGNGEQVVVVVRVDEEPAIEMDSAIDYKWIVCKVDFAGYEVNIAKDAELVAAITRAQRSHHRDTMRAALVDKIPGLANLGKLTTAAE